MKLTLELTSWIPQILLIPTSSKNTHVDFYQMERIGAGLKKVHYAAGSGGSDLYELWIRLPFLALLVL